MSAFLKALKAFAAHGVPIIPTAADSPSRPMVHNPAKFGIRACMQLADDPRFKDANAGFYAGPRSGITVVDVDSTDPAIVEEAIRNFGDTPLKVATPSGGIHLYYRHRGELRCIRLMGKPVDLLGRGLTVAPPSERPSSAKKQAGIYRCLEGDTSQLDKLPYLLPGSLPTEANVQQGGLNVQGVQKGARNNALFSIAIKCVRSATTEDELCGLVLNANSRFAEPLSTTEALGVARSAWNYKITDNLFSKGVLSTKVDMAMLHQFRRNHRALWLLQYLRCSHPPEKIFAIVPKAMEKSVGYSHNSITDDRELLVELGYLILVRRGGGGQGGYASQYRFGNLGQSPSQNLGGIELDTLSPLQGDVSADGGNHEQ